ncbi:hypothetical protein SVIOM342S_10543 [Streptomyces violaceorubidus]
MTGFPRERASGPGDGDPVSGTSPPSASPESVEGASGYGAAHTSALTEAPAGGEQHPAQDSEPADAHWREVAEAVWLAAYWDRHGGPAGDHPATDTDPALRAHPATTGSGIRPGSDTQPEAESGTGSRSGADIDDARPAVAPAAEDAGRAADAAPPPRPAVPGVGSRTLPGPSPDPADPSATVGPSTAASAEQGAGNGLLPDRRAPSPCTSDIRCCPPRSARSPDPAVLPRRLARALHQLARRCPLPQPSNRTGGHPAQGAVDGPQSVACVQPRLTRPVRTEDADRLAAGPRRLPRPPNTAAPTAASGAVRVPRPPPGTDILRLADDGTAPDTRGTPAPRAPGNCSTSAPAWHRSRSRGPCCAAAGASA